VEVVGQNKKKYHVDLLMTISKISGKWENSVLALFINNGFAGKKRKKIRGREF
jgi:hypothetical protein